MDRSSDENLPKLFRVNAGLSEQDLDFIEDSALRALLKTDDLGWGLRWDREAVNWDGKSVPFDIPLGTRVAIIQLKRITNNRLPLTYRLDQEANFPYAVAYVQDGELPEFPEEAAPLLADHHLDDITTIYEAVYAHDDRPGLPLVWRKVEGGDSDLASQDASPQPSSPRNRRASKRRRIPLGLNR